MNAEDEVEQFERAFAGGHPRAETEEDILDFWFRIAESQIPPENDRALLATRQNNRNHGFTGFWGKTTGSPSNGAPPQAQDPYRARGAAAFFRCQGIEYQLVRFSASARLTYLHGTATALLRHYYGTVTALLPWASRCPREQCRSSAVATPLQHRRSAIETRGGHYGTVGDPKLAEVEAPSKEEAERLTANLGMTGTIVIAVGARAPHVLRPLPVSTLDTKSPFSG